MMKDETFLRALSILGGISLLLASALAGVDGDLRIAAAGLIGFGVGVGMQNIKVRVRRLVKGNSEPPA